MSRRHRPVLIAVALLALLAPLVASSVGAGASAGLAAPSWKQVSAGENHTCAIASTDRLYCWGRNDEGQLGIGDQDEERFPVEVVGGWTDWTRVSAGANTTCALRSSRRLYCWGSNDLNGVGDGTDVMRLQPTQVWGNRTDWTAVSTGAGHACARRASGRLFCWGHNGEGQLGDGTDTRRPRPAQVAGNRTDWRVVDAGNGHTCARRASGRLFCWGENDDGEVGDGTTALRRLRPTQVAGRRTDWATVDTANHHTCATRTTGRLFCWGDGLGGQLGTGEAELRRTPAQVSGNRTDWRSVSLGYDHTCARRSSSQLYCWGSNNAGKLGDGTTDPRLLPTLVAGGFTDWRTVDAGSFHTCGRRASGQVYCWGYNAYGQVGDTSNEDRWSPTLVTLG